MDRRERGRDNSSYWICLLHKQDTAILKKVKQCDNYPLKVCFPQEDRFNLQTKTQRLSQAQDKYRTF